MATDALAAGNGVLTIDQAVEQLDAAEKKEQAPAEAVEAAQQPETPEAEPTVPDAEEPEAVIEGDAETDEPEAEEAQPAITPPHFWDAEAKKRFGELPRDLQELVLKKETERDKATTQAIEQAALKRKAAEGEASRIAQFNGVLDKLIPQAIETFKGRWEGVDWDKVVDQHGAEAALKLRNQMESERAQVQQLTAAKEIAEQHRVASFRSDRAHEFHTVVPEFVDPKTGNEAQQKVFDYLKGQGVPDEVILNSASAKELGIALKAMKWDEAQTKAKSQAANPATPKPAAQPARPSVRPTAATPSRNPQSARLQELSRKRSLTTDEAVELLDLKGSS